MKHTEINMSPLSSSVLESIHFDVNIVGRIVPVFILKPPTVFFFPFYFYFFTHSSLQFGLLTERSDPLSYLWRVITYLFDYFVNYLSIELLIHLHDKPWIMDDLIWDYCIQMPHCCRLGSRLSIKAHEEIKSTSQASLSSFEASHRQVMTRTQELVRKNEKIHVAIHQKITCAPCDLC